MLSSGDTCPTLGLFSQLIKRKPSGLPFSSHQLFRLKETGFGALGKDLGKSSWIWAQIIVPVECGWRCGWASGDKQIPSVNSKGSVETRKHAWGHLLLFMRFPDPTCGQDHTTQSDLSQVPDTESFSSNGGSTDTQQKYCSRFAFSH